MSNAPLEVMRLKLAFQTVAVYEHRLFYEAPRVPLLMVAFSEISRFLRRMAGLTLNISIPCEETNLSWGILTSLVRPPDNTIMLSINRKSDSIFLMHRGRPPRNLRIGGFSTSVQLHIRRTLMKYLLPQHIRKKEGIPLTDVNPDQRGMIEIIHTFSSHSVQARLLDVLGSYTSQLKVELLP